MQEHNLFLIFLRPMNHLNISYFVTGATAAIIYGEPRLTNDLDLVIELSSEQVPQFINLFPLDDFYCPPEEVIKIELSRHRKGHFNLIHHETGFKADVYLSGEDPLHRWAMENRKSVEIEGEKVWLAPPEYVIIRKLQYYHEGGSEKHVRDIQSILEVSKDQIDFEHLEGKIGEYRLQHVWERVKRKK